MNRNNPCLVVFLYLVIVFTIVSCSKGESVTEAPVVDPCKGVTLVKYTTKTYNTVQIGNQCWLKQNLDTGIMITGTLNQSNNGKVEKYCYKNDTANCRKYGGLYQWTEAMNYIGTEKAQGICPIGWHIPTLAEFTELNTVSGNSLKEVGQGLGAGKGTNTSGFSALLGGFRNYSNGVFSEIGVYTYFWSSTKNTTYTENYMYLLDIDSLAFFYNGYDTYGFCVRCIKNN